MTQPELGDVSLRSPECWVSELAMMCLLSKHEFVFGILSEKRTRCGMHQSANALRGGAEAPLRRVRGFASSQKRR